MLDLGDGWGVESPKTDLRGLPYFTINPLQTAGLLCAPKHSPESPPLCRSRGPFPQHEAEATVEQPQSTEQHLGKNLLVMMRLFGRTEPIFLTPIPSPEEEGYQKIS